MERSRAEVGPRIRSARLQRDLSLAHVADRSGISVATLSRIETAKQAIDVDLLVTLAGILGLPPAHLLDGDDGSENLEVLADRVGSLRSADRAKLLRTAASRRRRNADAAAIIEDMLSTLDIVREELEHVARSTRRSRRR